MKKIIVMLLALLLIVSMAIPAYAVTPELGAPDMPEIPDISDDIKIEIDIPDSYWGDWFEKHPVEVPAEKITDEHEHMPQLLKKWADRFPLNAYNPVSDLLKKRLEGAF